MKSNTIVGIPSLGKTKTLILAVCFFLICFCSSDTMIFSTASASMLSDIGGEQYYSLIVSLKNITVVITCMLCGKLIEKIGRRDVMLLGLLLEAVTNFAAGLVTNMIPMLILRALFGMGQGLSTTAVMIMIGELFGSKSGYGYMITLLGYGASNVLTPIITAFLVENYTWRWALEFLTIITVLAFFLLVIACPNYRIEKESAPLDKNGMLYFSVALCLIVAVLFFGGTQLAWNSATAIFMMVAGIGFMILFVHHERNMDQNIAIFPVSILRSKLLVGCAVGQLTMSINSACLFVYIPYYMQQEMHSTPTQAGTAVSIISLLSTVVGSIMLVAMVKVQRHSTFALATVVTEAISLVLIYAFLSPTLSVNLLYILVTLYGLAQCVEVYAFTMTVQIGLPASKAAMGTAVIQFVRQLNGIIAPAIASPIINFSADFGSGIKNLFLVVAVITVLGTVIFAVCVPSSKKIRENAAQEQIEV